MDAYRGASPDQKSQGKIGCGQEGLTVPTSLRGYAAPSRAALAALIRAFGKASFSFGEVPADSQVGWKQFSKLRVDGVVIKAGGKPTRWRISERYLRAHVPGTQSGGPCEED